MTKLRRGTVMALHPKQGWVVMTPERANREHYTVLTCSMHRCDNPARYIDHLFPYHTEACRCEGCHEVS